MTKISEGITNGVIKGLKKMPKHLSGALKKLPNNIVKEVQRAGTKSYLILKLNTTRLAKISDDALFSEMKLLQEGAVIKLTDGSDAIFENIRYIDDLGEKTGTITIVKNGDELGFRILGKGGTRFIAKSGTELKTFLNGITELPTGVPYSGKTYRYIGSQYADETVTIIHSGITDAGNRLRKGLYLSETKPGNIIEVGANGGTNGKNLFEITDFQVNNLLDITDPNTIEILGTTFEQMKKIHPNDLIQYEFTQEIAIWAKNNGYSGVKFYGAHGSTDYVNLLIFEQSTVNTAIKGSINSEPW
ncbi:hypothetical protein BZARG_2543 [Bizionia argentinensis JUB59]|uniref:Uncharacterized protein n=1 Tax=Bizionia argentinensis JUB59 TaxID=1046627 RepID=G2EGS6_9FLAO|nr:hypothetical protein [Bizionia argentinensis]EGV42313.1 hypothetical protein BZARG_2543 [Bizionia argentinensis JUB59]